MNLSHGVLSLQHLAFILQHLRNTSCNIKCLYRNPVTTTLDRHHLSVVDNIVGHYILLDYGGLSGDDLISASTRYDELN